MDWIQSLNWQQILAVVTALAATFFAVRDKLPAMPKLKKANETQDDPDVADLHALKRLEARAERSNCDKLQKAVRDVEVCFFNHGAAVEG